MKRIKNETLSIRTSADVKQLVRMAAEGENRSIASMMEALILAYARQHGLQVDAVKAEQVMKQTKKNNG